MREVAPAVTGTQSAIKAAMSAAVNVLVITAPQCDGRLLMRSCERRASRHARRNALSSLMEWRERRLRGWMRPGRKDRATASFAGLFTQG
jgi:hypothetical protein